MNKVAQKRGAMILKKLTLGIFFLTLLNGCVQSSAFLGPVYTLSSTGNVFQTGLSYGSGKAVTSLTGRTTEENIKNLLQPKDEDSDFERLIKQRIKKTRKIMNLVE
tara:strand:- start:85 stop:402 length:318 start_codon:yes stop_codon:yes gene_type:complete